VKPENISRIFIQNPFDRSQRIIDRPICSGGTYLLTDYLLEYLQPQDARFIVLHNGQVISPALRETRLVKPGDCIVIAPALAGGGGDGGKSILRMVAMIAVMAAAIIVPFALASAGVIASATGVAGALIGAGIAVGGSLLITALTPKPKLGASSDTTVYGWAGPQMTAGQGTPIQKGYGIFPQGGKAIASYITTMQDQQYMNILLCYGWGPGRSITDIKINDNPIENYKGVTVEKRLGYNEQTPISFFNDVVNEFPQSTQIRVSTGPVVFAGHGTDTEAVEVEVNYPKGLWAGPNPDGSYDPWTVFYKVEYGLHGSGTFTTALSPRVTGGVGSTAKWLAVVQDQFSGGPNDVIVVSTSNNDDHFEGEPFPGDIGVTPVDPFGVVQPAETRRFTAVWQRNPANDPNGVASAPGAPLVTVTNWSQVSDSVTGNRTTIIRHVTRINLPSAGQWDIRVTKLGSGQNTTVPTPNDNDSPRRGEEMWVTSIREIAHDALSYPNMILLGIRALATDQLSGSGVNVTATIDYGDPESLGYKHVIAADRPQAYYRLGDSSGTVCTDSSGRGHDATYSATGVTLGQAGLINSSADTAALFDGAGTTKITTPSLPLSTGYVVDMWIKPSAFGGMLAGNAASGDGFYLDATGVLKFRFGGVDHLSGIGLTLNTVYHVALLTDGATALVMLNGDYASSGVTGTPALTVDTLLKGYAGIADEVCICSPVIQHSRMKTRYQFGISERNKMEDFTGNQQSSVCWDAMTNPLYGGGIDPTTEIDIDSFVSWANTCNELVDDGEGGQMFRYSFDGVFDTTGNLLDSLNKVSTGAHANVILAGGRKYTVVQDTPSVADQLFTMGSIIAGSFKETWLALADRANSVDIQFNDANDGYKRKPITVRAQPQIDADGEIRPGPSIDGFGFTTEAQCVREGNYRLLSNQLLIRAIQFDADVEAIATQLGDTFWFSHDVPQWGTSGRIDASTDTSHVTLDRQVTMDPAKNYQLLVQLPSVLRFSGTIGTVAGLRVILPGFTGTARVKRLLVGGVDYAIAQYGPGFVDLDSFTAPTPGATATLYDIDAIEALAVVNTGNTTANVQTTSPFSTQPQQFDMYAFGEVNAAAKQFRCVKIAKSKDQQFTIYGLEYSDALYPDFTPVLSGSTAAAATMDVSNLTSGETFDLIGERWISFLRLGWRPGPLTVGADIYASINGGVERFVTTVNNHSSYLLEVADGHTVLARVVGFDVNGNRANYNTAPTVTATIQGVTTNLLQNPTFHAGLAHWDINWRVSFDNLQRGFDEDGFARYNIISGPLAAAQKFLSQVGIDPAKWAVGDYLMLSGYIQSGGGMTGHLSIEMVFNGPGTTVRAEWDLATATTGPTRINTAATQVTVGTTSIDCFVRIRDAGSGVSVAVGKLIRCDHLLLEVVAAGVTVPSKWADIDNGTNAANTLGNGSSAALAAQASMLPVVTGSFSVSVTDTTATITWTNLKIKWPYNSFITNVQDAFYLITGLTGGTAYKAVAYYDIVTFGQVFFVEGKTNAHGSPAGAYTALESDAIQSQIQDGKVPLGVVSFTTNAAGSTGSTSQPNSGGRDGSGGSGAGLGVGFAL
jgi:predicted phage tail protein